MRRYRKGRVPADLDFVRGPWSLRWSFKFPESRIGDLMDFQRRAGITVDGVLGPQTWVALAEENERNRVTDYLHQRYGTVSAWEAVGGE